MRLTLMLFGMSLLCSSGCNALLSSYNEDLGDIRKEWEVANRINETSVELDTLPDLIKSAVKELGSQNQLATPKTILLSRYGTFLAYRVLLEGGVEYHLDAEGQLTEKPIAYSVHGGVI